MEWELTRWSTFQNVRHRFKRDISIKEFCLFPWESEVENTNLSDEQILEFKKIADKL